MHATDTSSNFAMEDLLIGIDHIVMNQVGVNTSFCNVCLFNTCSFCSTARIIRTRLLAWMLAAHPFKIVYFRSSPSVVVYCPALLSLQIHSLWPRLAKQIFCAIPSLAIRRHRILIWNLIRNTIVGEIEIIGEKRESWKSQNDFA